MVTSMAVVMCLVSVTVNNAVHINPSNTNVDEAASASEAMKAVLRAPTPCGLILLSDSPNSVTSWQNEAGTASFEVVASDQTNITHQLSQLVPLARQVRQSSRCTMVVVVSQDPAFLAAFAEWSMRGRLLVWATKLVVVTRLALSQLQALLPTHWTFSMMNTVVLNKYGTSFSYQVLSLLPYSPAGPQLVQVASWTHQNGLVVAKKHTLFREKFSNFYGARVNVTALPFAPFWEEREGSNGTTLYSGTDYNTLTVIAGALNFTARVLPTSSWAEVTRLVEERVSFMAPVIYMVMPDRLQRYDFSFVYEMASMDFSMAPPGLQPRWEALYYPLSQGVWASTLLSIPLTALVFLLVIRAVGDKTHGGSGFDFGMVSEKLTGMLLGQNLPRRLLITSSSRVLIAAWLVFSLIIGLAYRSNLTAFLTLPKYPTRPETLQELVDAVDRITMQPYGEEFKNFFGKSDSPVYQKLSRLIYFVPSLVEGQQQAVDRNQAHLDNRRYQHLSIAKRLSRPDGSELLYIGRESIMPGQSAWPLPHDAPYTAAIDRHLMAVVEVK